MARLSCVLRTASLLSNALTLLLRTTIRWFISARLPTSSCNSLCATRAITAKLVGLPARSFPRMHFPQTLKLKARHIGLYTYLPGGWTVVIHLLVDRRLGY